MTARESSSRSSAGDRRRGRGRPAWIRAAHARRRAVVIRGAVDDVDLGYAGAQHAGHAVGRRVALLQLPGDGLLGRIAARHRQPADRAVVLEDVDDAPVGQGADRDVGDFLQGGFVVERRVEQVAGFGQHFEPTLGGDGLFAGDGARAMRSMRSSSARRRSEMSRMTASRYACWSAALPTRLSVSSMHTSGPSLRRAKSSTVRWVAPAACAARPLGRLFEVDDQVGKRHADRFV